MSEESGKRKLTLSVDEKVIEKAKDLGLNLSEVTESVLRSFAFKPSEADREEEYRKYEELFDSMKPLLQEYDTSAKVGRVPQEPVEIQGERYPVSDVDLLLGADGRIWMTEFESFAKGIRDFELWHFLSPKEILANFVSSLSEAKERRKEKLGELEMAKRIIDAISETMKSGKQQSKVGLG